MTEIRITREKLYQVRSHPGPAWTWSYKAHVPERHPWQYGPGLASLRDQIKKRYPDAVIVEAWR